MGLAPACSSCQMLQRHHSFAGVAATCHFRHPQEVAGLFLVGTCYHLVSGGFHVFFSKVCSFCVSLQQQRARLAWASWLPECVTGLRLSVLLCNACERQELARTVAVCEPQSQSEFAEQLVTPARLALTCFAEALRQGACTVGR